MGNGVLIKETISDKIDLTPTMTLYREGNTMLLRVMGEPVSTNPIATGIPSNLLPSVGFLNTVILYRTNNPTHSVGYVSLKADGDMDVIQPYNGSYIQPTDCTIYGEITWSLQ